MKAKTLEIKVLTPVGLLTVVLVLDEKQGGYTAFFKEKEWDNLITEGNTIDDSITNLLDLLNVVLQYKKDKQPAINFGEWIRLNATSTSAVQGKWYVENYGYIKDTETLYDFYVSEVNKLK
jgi:hypothetical protein